MVDRNDIEAAAALVAGRVRETPVIAVDGADLGVPGQLNLKLELHQHTGSFKPRGAFKRMLQGSLPPAGVIAASGGNHGLAVAYAARSLGVPAEVFVPVTSGWVPMCGRWVSTTRRRWRRAPDGRACRARVRPAGGGGRLGYRRAGTGTAGGRRRHRMWCPASLASPTGRYVSSPSSPSRSPRCTPLSRPAGLSTSLWAESPPTY